MKETIKISVCQKCGGDVRQARKKSMTEETISEFAREAFNRNLAIIEISENEYYSRLANWCKCKKDA